MSKNSNMHRAKKAKQDEFYTQLSDIENELKHYRNHLKNKTVFLNCDDPAESNFWIYFSLNFEFLGLKKLVSTHFETNKPSYKLELFEYNTEPILTPLKQNGDFRSDECVEILRESDIIVTNPPFSLFREFIDLLVENDKKFIVMGNNNAITYKEVFSLIKNNKVWLGINNNKTMSFRLPDEYEKYNEIDENGNKIGKVPAISWFTNLEHDKRNEELLLYKKYYDDPKLYPKYDNYDAIEVSRVKDIPMDYYGVMGVPITFLNRFNPDQFEILGINTSYSDEINHEEAKPIKKYVNVKQISKTGKISSGNKINDSSTILSTIKPDKTYYLVEGIEGHLTITYARLFIKNK